MTTIAAAVTNSGRRMSLWSRVFRSLGAVTGLFVAASAVPSIASGQGTAYRSAATAPPSWQTFAKELQGRFQQRLAVDDDGARRMQDAMVQHEKQSQEVLVVRTWVLPNGKIERLEFDGLDDADVAVNLRALLSGIAVGVPPMDMLQPLHLRLSLRASDQPRKDR